jgi:hypothetical protein
MKSLNCVFVFVQTLLLLSQTGSLQAQRPVARSRISLGNDSVKVAKASAADVNSFFSAYQNAKTLYQSHPILLDRYFSYKEIFEFSIADEKGETMGYSPEPYRQQLIHAPKITVQQMTINFQQISNIIFKRSIDSLDVRNLELLALSNKRSLRLAIGTLFPPGAYSIRGVELILKVIDSNGREIPDAKCYFLSRRTCREVICANCENLLEQTLCDITASKIMKQHLMFDMLNPAPITLLPGEYNLFVVVGNRVVHYEFRSINSSTSNTLLIKTKN